jgi:hypothetical protein
MNSSKIPALSAKSSLVASIIQQLPPDKICQMEGNSMIRNYVMEIVSNGFKHHQPEDEIIDILRKELRLLDGEPCWNSYRFGSAS